MYSDKVIDHYSNPRNVGEIENASGIGQVGNPVCGDIMKMYIKVEEDIIKDATFKTFGCGAAIATSSVATEIIKGKTIEEALKLTNKEVVDELEGLPSAKVHCSVLAEEAIREAIADYYRKQGEKSEAEIKEICGLKDEKECPHCDLENSGDE
ncbi:MAG: Fe-S cluster assembly scaffold protein NifU [Oscillospiraceae bacterium]|nr:Fe-S cluster assembly scaffold protein NifU [Oscillospiraceae bacterium]